jgi:hypothetical protein
MAIPAAGREWRRGASSTSFIAGRIEYQVERPRASRLSGVHPGAGALLGSSREQLLGYDDRYTLGHTADFSAVRA